MKKQYQKKHDEWAPFNEKCILSDFQKVNICEKWNLKIIPLGECNCFKGSNMFLKNGLDRERCKPKLPTSVI